jgi:two-component system sensor histidine kinase/response regulator
VARILVIEDDLDLADAVADTLREAGYEAETAPDGDSGLQALERATPDLVLCDVTLPGLDGYAVLDAIRRKPEGALLPFVFMTGRGGEENLRLGMSSGADDYVTKPFTSQTLLAAVSARLARASAAQSAAEARLDEMRRALSVLLPHELRTPLTTLLGGAAFLRNARSSLSDAEIDEMLGAMELAGERLKRLVENYLLHAGLELQRVSRADGGALRGESGPEEVESAAREHASAAGREADLALELAADARTPAAPPYLRKVVTELVDNALKFSALGSPVRIRLFRDGAGARLEVADRGRGMSAEQVAQIGAFRQFERSVYEQQGSGLGLALVRALVEGTGGRLEIESTPAESTTVRALWPGVPTTGL